MRMKTGSAALIVFGISLAAAAFAQAPQYPDQTQPPPAPPYPQQAPYPDQQAPQYPQQQYPAPQYPQQPAGYPQQQPYPQQSGYPSQLPSQPGYPPQASPYPQASPPYFPPQELDRVVQRIALYPDPLLAQILTAATFSDQIPAAAGWADQHHYLTGPALAAAIQSDQLPWDPSVQALLPFPNVLDLMASDPSWTRELGDAFLASQP